MEKSMREFFIPKRKLDILQIDGTYDEAEQRLKKPSSFNTTVIRMGLPDIMDRHDENALIQLFEQLSEWVESVLPAFIEWGAVVDRFGEDGVQLFFMDSDSGAVGAVGAAIQVREKLLKSESMWKDMTFGLTYGSVILGVLGGMGYYSVMSMSYVEYISQLLQQSAKKYSASILVTEQLLEHDPSIKSKYTHRLLGKFYFSGIDKAIKIYDFYDGDEITVRTAKRKTALLFEKGVSLFLAEDFVQARSYFIEVIKANRKDKAARAYLSLCDSFRENPPESPEALCIERL